MGSFFYYLAKSEWKKDRFTGATFGLNLKNSGITVSGRHITNPLKISTCDSYDEMINTG